MLCLCDAEAHLQLRKALVLMDQSLRDRRLIWTVAVDPHYQQGAGLSSRGGCWPSLLERLQAAQNSGPKPGIQDVSHSQRLIRALELWNLWNLEIWNLELWNLELWNSGTWNRSRFGCTLRSSAALTAFSPPAERRKPFGWSVQTVYMVPIGEERGGGRGGSVGGADCPDVLRWPLQDM